MSGNLQYYRYILIRIFILANVGLGLSSELNVECTSKILRGNTTGTKSTVKCDLPRNLLADEMVIWKHDNGTPIGNCSLSACTKNPSFTMSQSQKSSILFSSESGITGQGFLFSINNSSQETFVKSIIIRNITHITSTTEPCFSACNETTTQYASTTDKENESNSTDLEHSTDIITDEFLSAMSSIQQLYEKSSTRPSPVVAHHPEDKTSIPTVTLVIIIIVSGVAVLSTIFTIFVVCHLRKGGVFHVQSQIEHQTIGNITDDLTLTQRFSELPHPQITVSDQDQSMTADGWIYEDIDNQEKPPLPARNSVEKVSLGRKNTLNKSDTTFESSGSARKESQLVRMDKLGKLSGARNWPKGLEIPRGQSQAWCSMNNKNRITCTKHHVYEDIDDFETQPLAGCNTDVILKGGDRHMKCYRGGAEARVEGASAKECLQRLTGKQFGNPKHGMSAPDLSKRMDESHRVCAQRTHTFSGVGREELNSNEIMTLPTKQRKKVGNRTDWRQKRFISDKINVKISEKLQHKQSKLEQIAMCSLENPAPKLSRRRDSPPKICDIMSKQSQTATDNGRFCNYPNTEDLNIPSSIDVLPLDRDIDWERNRNDVTEVSQGTLTATGMAEECFPIGKRSYSAPDLSTVVANDSQKVFYHTLAMAASKDDLAICKRDSAVTYQSLELESVCIPKVFYQTLIMNASSDELGMEKRGNSVSGVS